MTGIAKEEAALPFMPSIRRAGSPPFPPRRSVPSLVLPSPSPRRSSSSRSTYPYKLPYVTRLSPSSFRVNSLYFKSDIPSPPLEPIPSEGFGSVTFPDGPSSGFGHQFQQPPMRPQAPMIVLTPATPTVWPDTAQLPVTPQQMELLRPLGEDEVMETKNDGRNGWMGTALEGIWNFWKGSGEAEAVKEKRNDNGRKGENENASREEAEREEWVVVESRESGDDFYWGK